MWSHSAARRLRSIAFLQEALCPDIIYVTTKGKEMSRYFVNSAKASGAEDSQWLLNILSCMAIKVRTPPSAYGKLSRYEKQSHVFPEMDQGCGNGLMVDRCVRQKFLLPSVLLCPRLYQDLAAKSVSVNQHLLLITWRSLFYNADPTTSLYSKSWVQHCKSTILKLKIKF